MKQEKLGQGKLFICATPIGNLGDVTMRVLETLRTVDTICAEDTRVSSRLLAANGIEKRIERLDEAALSKNLSRIVERLCSGETIAYCSDAGMPGVSDPGLRLVRAVQEAAIPIEVLPGASAVVTAYVASGFTNPRFFFGGFLPRKAGECRSELDELKKLDAVLLYYESPARLVASLETIAKVFPLREVAICRELTKLHEEVLRGLSSEVYEKLVERSQKTAIKGEIVIAIDAPSEAERMVQEEQSEDRARMKAQELKTTKLHSNKDIVALLQQEFGISRNAAYDIVVGL